jgi:hypothetical protein
MCLGPRPALVTAALLLISGASCAQELPRTLAHADLPVVTTPGAGWVLPDSVRRYPATHWKEGLLVGAAVGALFGAYLGQGLCHDSETRHGRSCIPSAVSGAVVLAVPTSVVGALVGGSFFKRSPPDSALGIGSPR